MRRFKRAYTLIELVVTISVVLILAAVAVGAYFGITSSASSNKLLQEARIAHKNTQLVGLDNSDNHSLNDEGIYIFDLEVFENKINEINGAKYTVINGENPNYIYQPTIYFYKEESVKKMNLVNSSYNYFAYYSHQVSGKRANVNIVTGEITIVSADFTIGTEVPDEPDYPEIIYINGFNKKHNNEIVLTRNVDILENTSYDMTFEVKNSDATNKEFDVIYPSDSNVGEISVVNNVYTFNAKEKGIFSFKLVSKHGGYSEDHSFNVLADEITSITLFSNRSEFSELLIGEELDLTIEQLPLYASKRDVILTCNPTDAFAFDNMTATVKKYYESATIIATTSCGNTDSLTFKILEEGFVLNNKDCTLKLNDVIDVSYQFFNVLESKQDIEITTNNEDVLMVVGNKVIAIGHGEANVSVKAISLGIETNFNVSVHTYVEDIITNIDEIIELERLSNYQINNIQVLPSYAENTSLIYMTDNEYDAVSVDSFGLVTANKVGLGKVYITASDRNIITKSITFKVNGIPVEDFDISLEKTSMDLDETLKINFVGISPSNADYDYSSFTYIIENSNVVKVENGIIYPLSHGKSKITVVSNNGIKREINIVVNNYITVGIFDYRTIGSHLRVYTWNDKGEDVQLHNVGRSYDKISENYVSYYRINASYDSLAFFDNGLSTFFEKKFINYRENSNYSFETPIYYKNNIWVSEEEALSYHSPLELITGSYYVVGTMNNFDLLTHTKDHPSTFALEYATEFTTNTKKTKGTFEFKEGDEFYISYFHWREFKNKLTASNNDSDLITVLDSGVMRVNFTGKLQITISFETDKNATSTEMWFEKVD